MQLFARQEFRGPYLLSEARINASVIRTAPGAYMLGYIDRTGFVVKYIGRADQDLREDLKTWVGKKRDYSVFEFCYADSKTAAFEKECEIYHHCLDTKEPLDSNRHPTRPEETTLTCHICAAANMPP
ncbi:MAG: hypothetical protein JXB04_12910 [Kiritimatiellae bacterium]|nr:hypothetical protein [Kiritimatiellia bacterium]